MLSLPGTPPRYASTRSFVQKAESAKNSQPCINQTASGSAARRLAKVPAEMLARYAVSPLNGSFSLYWSSV